MQTIRITTSQNIDIDYEIAGIGDRILAFLIDAAIFFLLATACVILYFITNSTTKEWLTGVYVIFYFVLYAFYDLLCEIFMNGQSVGKKTLKIRVMSLDGSRASVGQYLMRWIFRIVDFTISGGACALICTAVSKNSQRLGDMVAGTIVIRTVPRTKMDALAFFPAEEGYQPVFYEVTQLSSKDITLIHEILSSYRKSGNYELLTKTASKLKEHLKIYTQLDDVTLLQTLLNDYNFIVAAQPI